MTPGVVATAIVVAGLVVLGVTACVAYLAARDIDPTPVVQLAGTAAGGCVSMLTLWLQLTGRKTVTRVDRNTGVLASAVAGQLDQDGRPTGSPIVEVRRPVVEAQPPAQPDPEAITSWLPAVPPPASRARHRMPAAWETGDGPDVAGEASNRAR